MSEHTKEPWKTEYRGCGCGCVDVDNSAGETILLSVGADYARRIVACVNACAGIPTDELEQKGLQLYMHDHLKQQRDELLVAAKKVRPFIEEGEVPKCFWSEPFKSALAEFDAAIEKAK